MKTQKAVIDFAKSHGYEGAEFLNTWKGFQVYEPIFSYEAPEPPAIGLPIVILVNEKEIRLSTPEEAFEHIKETT